MNKKRIAIGCIVILLLAGYGQRVYRVNAQVEHVPTLTYSKGETVPFENDFNEKSEFACNGYTVKVENSEALTTEEYCNKYQVTTNEVNDASEYYYVVEVEIGNTNTEETKQMGVALNYFALVGTNYYLYIDSEGFTRLNPKMPGTSFSLRPGTSLKMRIPYAGVPSVHGELKSKSKDKPKLQITEYPHKKMIELE